MVPKRICPLATNNRWQAGESGVVCREACPPAATRRVGFMPGNNFHDGGRFDASADQPQVQIQRARRRAGNHWQADGLHAGHSTNPVAGFRGRGRTILLLPGGDLSRLGNGERPAGRSAPAQASPRRDGGGCSTSIHLEDLVWLRAPRFTLIPAIANLQRQRQHGGSPTPGRA